MKATRSYIIHLLYCEEEELMFALLLSATSFCLFVHLPSCKNQPYNLYPHPSLSPIGSWSFPIIHCRFWLHIKLYVMRVAFISMLISHLASNNIGPCGLHFHSISLQLSHLLWWPLRPSHHLESFLLWNIKLQFPIIFLTGTSYSHLKYPSTSLAPWIFHSFSNILNTHLFLPKLGP